MRGVKRKTWAVETGRRRCGWRASKRSFRDQPADRKRACSGLAGEGASVACLDLDGEEAETAAASVVSSGGSSQGWACDLTELGQVKRAVDRCVDVFGGVDVLCANAGCSQGEMIPFSR